MGIGKAGAKNSAVLALRILSLTDQALSCKLERFRQKMEEEVERKADKVEKMNRHGGKN
jgi:phosphoribosylcarboxyaminoimidazole (NCAIR) mutase